MYLDITDSELTRFYEEIQTILGGFDVEVDITKEEVKIALRNSLDKFEKECAIWQLKNQFINAYGMPTGTILNNQLATVNFNLVHQITDFFASMSKVGGKIPWHKDYILLEPGRQVYFLDKESSKPYVSGTRRINRVLWLAQPEFFGSTAKGGNHYDDVLGNKQWAFSPTGLNYGANRLGFLGYTFDTVLLMQSRELRNKIMFSEYFHNLSGDVLEITPMPGAQLTNIREGTKLFYYYWNEAEITAGRKLEMPNEISFEIDPENPNNDNGLTGLPPSQSTLIANPLQMQIDVIPWSSLSAWARTFVKDMTLAKCKYIQGSKWRVIQKTMSSGEMDYEINFDYSSIISEGLDEEKTLIENLRQDLNELAIHTLTENQKTTVENAVKISSRKPQKWFIG